jgi:hypothetical protein
MSGVLDFLFEGQPPPSVTAYGSSTQNLPTWLSDYTQGLVGRANQIAGTPYQPYGGPRVAGFTPQQQQAFGNVSANQGNYQPYLNQAGALTQTAGAIDVPGAAQPYMGAAGASFPQAAGQYMDPYVGNVINRAELEANRNFNENIMPSLTNKFTSAGQYGSSANQREADVAARNLTEGLQSTSLGALSNAYEQGAGQFESDVGRQAQLAGLAGQLASTQGNLGLAAGRQEATLGDFAQSAGLKDVGALQAAGAAQQQFGQTNLDTAYQDFLNQRQYPQQQASWLSSIINGTPYAKQTTTQQTTPAQPGQLQNSGLSQIGTAVTAGKGIWDTLFPATTTGSARGGIIRRARGGKTNAASHRARGGLTMMEHCYG